MRLSTSLMLFLILVSGTAGFADAAGIWQDWGVKVDLGVQEEVQQAQESFSSVSSGSLGAGTLISLYLTVLNTLEAAFEIITALPDMLKLIGVPTFIADLLNLIVPILVGRGILAAYTGREI